MRPDPLHRRRRVPPYAGRGSRRRSGKEFDGTNDWRVRAQGHDDPRGPRRDRRCPRPARRGRFASVMGGAAWPPADRLARPATARSSASLASPRVSWRLAFAYGAWTLQPWAWMLGVVAFGISLALARAQRRQRRLSAGQIISIVIAVAILYYLFTPAVKRPSAEPDRASCPTRAGRCPPAGSSIPAPR